MLSIIPYATAATAGLLWGWLMLGSDDGRSSSVRVLPAFGSGHVALGVDGKF